MSKDSISAVTTADVNFRQSPNGSVLATLAKDTPVDVSGHSGNWLLGTVDGKVGYLYCKYLKATDAGSWSGKVIASSLNLRKAPDTGATVLAVLSNGTLVSVEGWTEGWLAVRAGANSGFVSNAYVEAVRPVVETPMTPGTALVTELNPAQLKQKTTEIQQLSDPTARGNSFEALQALVPYFSQRDSMATEGGKLIETSTGNMCNLTSLAMVLSFLGVENPGPAAQFEDSLEALRQAKKLPERTTSSGWGGVAKALGVGWNFISSTPVVQGQSWWEQNVRPSLRQGNGVMMSITGHIVRVQAVTAQGLVVDDPFGYSILGAGTARSFKSRNPDRGASGVMSGKDLVYPWADVANHQMLWIAEFYPPDPNMPLSFADEELPEVRDDEPSDPNP
jgi:SH3-like domain-containing protein